MSLKQEIETWVQALAHYDNNEFEESISVFGQIADTAKILFNCGVIFATLGEHYNAIDCFQKAITLDKYFAIAYFQQGVSNFLVGDFEEALVNFNDTLLYLRGNTSIDYEQLGLKFKLFSCEVLFNRGLCYVYMQETELGMNDLQFAAKEKAKPDHDVIDEAIGERAEGYTVFSIPVGVLYRPSEAKVKNLKTKEYLGKARLVAASENTNTFTGFQGPEIKRSNTIAKDDRPPETISYAATNLVQKNLGNRTRQQSEPPISRNVFPPTPPPEGEKAPACTANGSTGSILHRRTNSASVREPQPTALEYDPATMYTGFNSIAVDNRPNLPAIEKLRIGTTRAASETRGPRHHNSIRAREQPPNQQILFRETTWGPRQHPEQSFGSVPEEGYRNGGYSMYNTQRKSGGHLNDVEEECCDGEDDDCDALDDIHFEMLDAQLAARRGAAVAATPPARTKVRKIRVKVHAHDDTRFIIIGPSVELPLLGTKIREKFGFKAPLKIKMQDEGDMVTLGDQDDLDFLLSTTRKAARKENNEMGKMEIWVSELNAI